jgi:hypothetical protein
MSRPAADVFSVGNSIDVRIKYVKKLREKQDGDLTGTGSNSQGTLQYLSKISNLRKVRVWSKSKGASTKFLQFHLISEEKA